MGVPIEQTVDSFQEFVRFVETKRQGTTSMLWFRGTGDSTHQLIPSLYRHPTETDVARLLEMEEAILNRFKQRSMPFEERIIQNDWEFLFLMQHYGVPTRLLDWSENPFVALYFAITAAEALRNRGSTAFATTAAVWLLDTGMWNEKVAGGAWKRHIPSFSDSVLNPYLPTGDLKKMNMLPIAMAGLHNSRRIVAQRGAFTIFGQRNRAMEVLFDEEGFPAEALVKLVLPQANLEGLRNSLFGAGYADSMIYPDLGGLAKEIKRQLGYEV